MANVLALLRFLSSTSQTTMWPWSPHNPSLSFCCGFQWCPFEAWERREIRRAHCGIDPVAERRTIRPRWQFWRSYYGTRGYMTARRGIGAMVYDYIVPLLLRLDVHCPFIIADAKQAHQTPGELLLVSQARFRPPTTNSSSIEISSSTLRPQYTTNHKQLAVRYHELPHSGTRTFLIHMRSRFNGASCHLNGRESCYLNGPLFHKQLLPPSSTSPPPNSFPLSRSYLLPSISPNVHDISRSMYVF